MILDSAALDLEKHFQRQNCGPRIVVTLGLWKRPYSQSNYHSLKPLVYPLAQKKNNDCVGQQS